MFVLIAEQLPCGNLLAAAADEHGHCISYANSAHQQTQTASGIEHQAQRAVSVPAGFQITFR